MAPPRFAAIKSPCAVETLDGFLQELRTAFINTCLAVFPHVQTGIRRNAALHAGKLMRVRSSLRESQQHWRYYYCQACRNAGKVPDLPAIPAKRSRAAYIRNFGSFCGAAALGLPCNLKLGRPCQPGAFGLPSQGCVMCSFCILVTDTTRCRHSMRHREICPTARVPLLDQFVAFAILEDLELQGKDPLVLYAGVHIGK